MAVREKGPRRPTVSNNRRWHTRFEFLHLNSCPVAYAVSVHYRVAAAIVLVIATVGDVVAASITAAAAAAAVECNEVSVATDPLAKARIPKLANCSSSNK